MVSTLPQKPPAKGSTSTPTTHTATFTTEPEELPKPQTLLPEPRTRNHHRSNTGSAVFSHEHTDDAKKLNRVLMVLMRRLGNSKTFGENIIFILNRAGEATVYKKSS